jgi:hypothetical protein
MLRKRYSVVVIGEGGTSAAQRSEVSRHRGEREARAAAEEELERLGVVHGDRAGHYRVILERDGETIADVGVSRPPGGPPERTPLASPAPAGAVDDDPAPEGDTASAPVLDEAVLARFLDEDLPPADPGPGPDTGGTSEQPVPAPAGDRTRPRERPRMPGHDDIPSGPVPEEVLRRFEDAIAREERRRRSDRAEDVAS